jgi:hypothetical protein
MSTKPTIFSWKMLAAVLALCLPAGAAGAGAGAVRAEADSPDGYRVSEPVVHGNLAIYFVHGTSRPGRVPLTLQEALKRRVIEVRETGNVNTLEIENNGDEEIFIQGGEIVKGGKQDRVLSMSMVVPPRSGAIPIGAFCVEHGRWSPRGAEEARRFSSAAASLPSRRAKLDLADSTAGSGAVGTAQQRIWDGVAKIQDKLSSNLGASVKEPQSQSSLQLSLENGRLVREQDDYIAALEPRGLSDNDIVGYVFAINGKVNSADIYPSNGLFKKLWPKLLRASVTEAIGEKSAAAEPAPQRADVAAFITSLNGRRTEEKNAGKAATIRKRESEAALFTETRPAAAPASGWVHRNYLAR